MTGDRVRGALRIAGASLAACLLSASLLLLPGCAGATPEELAAKRAAAAGYEKHVSIQSGAILALSKEGKVFFPENIPSATAAIVSQWEGMVQVAASSTRTIFGLRPDGTVAVAAHEFDRPWADAALGWEGVVQIACNKDGVYGLKEDGTVVATAIDGEYGRLDVEGWKDVIELYSSPTNSMMYGLTSGGRVLCTYEGDRETVGAWTDVVQFDHSKGWSLGLRADGTVYSDGYSDDIAAQIADWEGIVQVAAAGEYGLAAGLKADGTVAFTGDPARPMEVFGFDGTHELVEREGYDEPSLAEIEGWRDVAAIEACNSYLLGLTADGRVLFAGRNGSARNSAFDTSSWRGVVAVFASDPSFVALKEDGTLEGYVNHSISGFPPLW